MTRPSQAVLPIDPAPVPRGTDVAADVDELDRNAREMHRGLVTLNIAVLALMVTLAAVALRISLDSYDERGHDATMNIAGSLQQAVGASLERVDLALQTVQLAEQRLPGGHVASLGGIDLTDLLAQQQLLVPAITGLGVLDVQGRLRHRFPAANPAEPSQFAETETFRRTMDDRSGRLIVTGPVQSAVTKQWSLLLSRPLTRADGSPAGIVYAHVPAEHFESLFAAVKIGVNGAVSLRTLDRRLVARRTGLHVTQHGLGSHHVSAGLATALDSDASQGFFVSAASIDGVERMTAYHRVGDHPLVVVVGLARADYLKPWRAEAAVVISLAALVVLALAGSSVLVDRSWRRSTASALALMRERNHHRALLRTATDGIHVLDRHLRVVELSDSFATLLGRSRESLLGAHPSSWDSEHLTAAGNPIELQLREHGHFDIEARYRRPDGSLVDVQVLGSRVRIDGRDLLYCSARDISGRKRTERELRSSREFLDRTGRIARVGGWEWDLDLGRGIWSDETYRLLDIPPGPPPSSEAFYAMCSPGHRELLEAAITRCRRDGSPWDLEVELTTPAGRTLWIRSVGEAQLDGGRAVRVIGALQDITELRRRQAELQREQALRVATERHAEELNALLTERSEMLDVMAHEVRQPLNNASAALQGAMSAMKAGLEPNAARPLVRAQVVLAQVVASLDNTLAVATLLARPDPIERQDTDIDTLVAVTLADIPPEERSRVRVERVTRTRTASLDMGLMRLALRNLVANALKYSPSDSPVCVRISDSDEPLALMIDVLDNGEGIEPELVGHLGRRGARGKRNRGKPGLGLGLHIVQRVMALHGGELQLLRNAPPARRCGW